MKRRVKIPGSKYELSLEDEENQWFLKLRIGSAVEEEIPVTHMDKKAIRTNIVELLDAVHLQLNNIQIDMVHQKVVSFISEILSGTTGSITESELTNDPRIPDIIGRIKAMHVKIGKLEERLSIVEGRSSL